MAQSLKEKYFDWMCELVRHNERRGSYLKLLRYLDSADFQYSIEMDGNRFEDGINLRYRFGYDNDYLPSLIANSLDVKPCSVLEMMIALSIRCEEIMDAPEKENQTGEWFFNMIDNLGLTDMTDSRFNREYCFQTVERFLEREYEPNGKGGLFTVKKPKTDMRNVEIWYQMMWYINEYLNLN